MGHPTIERIARYLSSVVFLFSGISKLLDIFRTRQKMSEYLVSLNMDIDDDAVMFMAILLIMLELVISFALAIRVKVRAVSCLSLSLLFLFVLLTTISVKWGSMESCGCFGEVLHLTYELTLAKNILLMVLLTVVLKCNCEVTATRMSSCIVIVTAGLIVTVGLLFQPIVDFGSNRVGVILMDRNGDYVTPIDYDFTESHFGKSNRVDMERGLVLVGLVNNTDSIEDTRLHDFMQRLCQMGKNALSVCVLASCKDERFITYSGEVPVALVESRVLNDIVSSPLGYVVLKDGLIVAKWWNSPFSFKALPEDLNDIYDAEAEKHKE